MTSVLRTPLTLRRNRRAIRQELRAGCHHLVSRLDAFQHNVIVADRVTDAQRFLMRDQLAVLVFSDEREILASDARDGEHWNDRAVMRSPDHAGANELLVAQLVFVVSD